VLCGLLPLAHAHSFTSSIAAAAALACLFPAPRAWARFFLPALGLGLPQVALLAHGTSMQAGSFVGLHLGWDRGTANPLTFWLWNAGAFIPLWLVAAAWRGRTALLTPAQRRFHLPFALFFVVPNLLRLSPWIWDNVKFLIVWFVAAAPLVALVLVRVARVGRPERAAAVALVVVLTLSGALDLWRVGTRQVWLPLTDARGLEFARGIAAVTPPGARLLHWPLHHAPALFAGRASLLGYAGHIWSQGFDAGTRADEIAAFYAGAPESEAVLRRHRIDFVVLGPEEQLYAGPVPPDLLTRWPVVLSVGPYRLHDVRAARDGATPPRSPGP
jgi:hypothetical protein